MVKQNATADKKISEKLIEYKESIPNAEFIDDESIDKLEEIKTKVAEIKKMYIIINNRYMLGEFSKLSDKILEIIKPYPDLAYGKEITKYINDIKISVNYKDYSMIYYKLKESIIQSQVYIKYIKSAIKDYLLKKKDVTNDLTDLLYIL